MQLKKSFGQHLLIAGPTTEKIVRTLGASNTDVVLEIGPGSGNMTEHLLRSGAKVVAIEKDGDMVARLAERFGDTKNLVVVHGDFLKTDLEELFGHLASKALFCGNLPYNISTPILFKLLESKRLFSHGLVMVQREVALRMTARAGGKDYGVLGIMLQSRARLKKCFDVSPKSFLPPPKVWSSIVAIDFPETPPYDIARPDIFEKIVKLSFQSRRKMLRNGVPQEYLFALEVAGIDGRRRPETLSIDEFVAIADAAVKP